MSTNPGSTYAVITSGVVTNLVVWDGESDWAPPQGATAVLIPIDTFVNIGYTYNGSAFAAPAT